VIRAKSTQRFIGLDLRASAQNRSAFASFFRLTAAPVRSKSVAEKFGAGLKASAAR
jgi:hypothetical protein